MCLSLNSSSLSLSLSLSLLSLSLSEQVLLPRTKSVLSQRHSQTGKKKKMESTALVGDLEVGKTLLSDLGGDRLKEMEMIHTMEEEEVK